MQSIIINSDGGVRGNGQEGAIGAWGYTMQFGEHYKEDSKAYPCGTCPTNNQMELLATINALESIKTEEYPIIIRQDSKYVLDGAKTWIHGWKKRGWKTANKQPVKNIELWKRLDKQLIRFAFSSIKFQHVAGHSGNAGNTRVDLLCNIAMDNLSIG